MANQNSDAPQIANQNTDTPSDDQSELGLKLKIILIIN